jgi:hypothetical protein
MKGYLGREQYWSLVRRGGGEVTEFEVSGVDLPRHFSRFDQSVQSSGKGPSHPN